MFRALRLKSTYVGPGLMLLVVACTPLLQPLSRGEAGAYAYIGRVTPTALGLFGVLTLITYCTGLIAQDLSNGMARSILVRPILRHEYVLAKVLVGLTYAIALVGIVAVGSWSIAYLFGELVGVSYGGELVSSAEQMRDAYLLGLALSLGPLAATVGYAILISTITRNAVAAVSGAVGLWLAVDLIKYPLGIDRFMFSTYIEAPWQVFINRCDGIDTPWFPMVWYCLGSSLSVFAVTVSASAYVMHRRNLRA
jgi:hypothetical protein